MKPRYKLIVLLLVLVAGRFAVGTPLDDYVKAPDDNYSFSVANTIKGEGYTAYVLDMTSQAWRSRDEVDRTLWKHWLTIVMPDEVASNKALLWITGGSNGSPAPSKADSMVAGMALKSKTVTAELRMVPNEPLVFPDGGGARSEDGIIAYTFDKYMSTGDSTWPLLLPMVKSAVRAMDTVHSHISSVSDNKLHIHEFVVSGGSKRGWTAWLTAAVDTRVTAVSPIVSDLLNMKRTFAHHWSCYGFWADALWPYEEMNIFDRFDSPRADDLLAIVDPYEYRHRLNIPKFIVTVAGDDFFVHDSIQFYLDDLLGETYVRTVPNTNHYLDGAQDEVLANMVPFYDAFLTGQPRPEFSWTLNDDGSMTVLTADTPVEVKLWQADNPTDRDFRQETIGNTWTSSILTEQSPGVYVADPGIPPTGWRSYFVELVYDYQTPSYGISPYDYHLTTEVRVLPEVRPFEADLSRDRITDVLDLVILAENWLSAAPYYDIMPRRTGDGIINLAEASVFSLHWLEAN